MVVVVVVVVVGGGRGVAIFTKFLEKSGEIGIFFATKSHAIVGQNYFKCCLEPCSLSQGGPGIQT